MFGTILLILLIVLLLGHFRRGLTAVAGDITQRDLRSCPASHHRSLADGPSVGCIGKRFASVDWGAYRREGFEELVEKK